MYKWLPLPDDHSQKGEIPASSLTRGGGLKRFCSELISSLRKTTTSELANPMFWGPADQMHPDTPGGGVEAIYADSLPGLFPGPLREERGAKTMPFS